MYISPVGCFVVGAVAGILLTLITIVGVALYMDNKKKRGK